MVDVVITVKLRNSAPRHCTASNLSLWDTAGIAAAAQERFLASAYVGLRSLSCEQHEGFLVLRGRVSSYYYKQLAQEVIRNLAGPLTILNAVQVAHFSGAVGPTIRQDLCS